MQNKPLQLVKKHWQYGLSILLVAIIIVSGIVYFLRSPETTEAAWWNDTWLYRQAIAVTNAGSELTNYQIEILADEDLSALVTAGKLQADLDDLRFTDRYGNKLKYWIEDATGSSVNAWVEISSIPSNGALIYMYYGNSGVASESNAVNIIGNSGNSGTSCTDIKNNRDAATGTYYITGTSSEFQVYCDMDTEGGGWTEIINLDTNDGTDHWWGDTTFWQGTGIEGLASNSLTTGHKSQAFTDMSSFTEMMFFLHTEGVEVAYGVYDLLGGYQSSSFYDLLNTANSDAGTTITGTLQHQSGASGSPLNTARNQTRYGDEFVDSFNTEAVVVNRVKRFNTDGINYMRLATTFDNTSYVHTFSGLGVHHERPTGSYITKLEAAPVTAYCGLIPRYGSDATATGAFCGTVTSYDRDMAVFVRDSTPVTISLSFGSPSTEQQSPGPVIYLSFDEGYGSTVYNHGSSQYNGVLTGANWQNEEMCISGSCLYFDGSTSRVLMDTVLTFGITDSWTVSFWNKVPTTNDGSWQGLFGDTITSSGGYWFYHSGGKLSWYQAYTDHAWGWMYSNQNLGDEIPYNEWVHITLVNEPVDSDTNKVTIYINGLEAQNNNIDWYSGSSTFRFENIGRDGSSRYFTGYMDEFKVYPYKRTLPQIRKDYQAGLSGVGGTEGIGTSFGKKKTNYLSQGLIGYWPLDDNDIDSHSCALGGSGDTCDQSGTGSHGTDVGIMTDSDYVAGKFGYGLEFDGAGSNDDYMTVAGLDTQLLGAQGTISAWAYPTATGDNRYVFQAVGAGTNRFYVQFGGGGFSVTRGNPAVTVTVKASVTLNQWHHLVLSWDATNLYGYYNGEYIGTNTYVNAGSAGAGSKIGAQGASTSFPGTIDEVRAYNRKLSGQEIKDLYNWAPGPEAYYSFDEGTGTTTYDKSGNGRTGTLQNGASWGPGKYGQAVKLNIESNDNQYVTVSSNVTHKYAFTKEAWIYPTTISGCPETRCSIISNYFELASNSLQFYSYQLSSSGWHTGGTISLNEWQHAAVSYDGTNLKLYLNGIEVKSVATSRTTDFASSQIIGAYSSNNRNFKGYIDEVRIYDYARTPKQIVSDMNAGHPAGGSPVASQLLYLKFDEGYGTTVYDSGFNDDDGILANGVAWTNNGKIGKALSFDGLNDHIYGFTSGPFEYTGAGLTLSTWVYINSSDVDLSYLISKPWNGSGQYNYRLYYDGSGSVKFYLQGASTWQTSTVAISTGSWHHLVATVDASANVKVYLDGISKYSGTHTVSDWTPSSGDSNLSLSIGTLYPYGPGWAGNTAFSLDGMMDEVKIYNFALTADEVLIDYNQNSSIVLGAGGTDSAGNSDNSAARTYCIPGDTSTCNPPVGEWKLDERTGSNAYDTSNNNNTGTITSATYVSGKYGSALQFNGTDTWVETTLSPAISAANDYTQTLWFYPTAEANGVLIDDYNRWEHYIQMNSNRTVKACYYDYTMVCTPSSSNQVTLNTWNHIAAVADSANYIKVFVNGEMWTENTSPGGVETRILNDMVLGASGNDHQNKFTGKIDHVKVFDYALSQAQIAYDYNRGAPIGWWKMDECSGTTIYDWGPNSNGGYNGNDGLITIGGSGTQTVVGDCETASSAWDNGEVGKMNYSISLDGTDDYLSVTDTTIAGMTNYTVTGWFKRSVVGATQYLLYHGNDGASSTPKCSLYFNTSNQLVNYNFTYLDDTHKFQFTTTNTYGADTWYHFAMINGPNGNKLYVDGVQQAGSYSTGDADNTGAWGHCVYTSNPVYFGAWKSGGSMASFMTAQLDDIRLYNYDLTTSQIQQVMNNGAVNFK